MGIDSVLLGRKYPELMKDERMKEITINDIPVMIGLRGEIICIPKKREIPSPIGCVGKKGVGKSLMLQRIADESYWNWGINVAIMNDFMEECYDWSKQQNNQNWISQLDEIGELPIPLPIVYIYQNHKNLDLEEFKKPVFRDKFRPFKSFIKGIDIKGKNINYIKTSIPFEEFLDNLDDYMDLERSGAYLRNFMKELKSCQSTEEVYDVIKTIDVGKASKSVWDKITANFNNVFNEEILHITAPACPEYVSCAGYKGNPFISMLNLGIIPCFITSNLWTQRYKSHVYAYHINAIYDAQSNILKGKKTYLIFDELTKVCSTEEKNKAEEALNNIAARGRMKNIGIVYATQNYGKIPHIIRTNTEYLFALRHNSLSEVNEVAKDFSVLNLYKNELLKLRKLECIGLTSEYFVIYHKNGDIEETSEPCKGSVIPPMSRHKMPG